MKIPDMIMFFGAARRLMDQKSREWTH